MIGDSMKRLNNKGFAISTILFSILILGTLVFGTLYSTMISNSPEKATENCPSNCPKCVCPAPPEEESDDKCTDEFIIGTEHFCVLFKDNTNVVALAKYNLNIGSHFITDEQEGLQSKNANEIEKGTVKATTDVQSESTMYGYYKMLDIQSNVSKYNNVTKDLPNINLLISSSSVLLTGYVDEYDTKLRDIISTNNLGISNLKVRLLNIDDLNDSNNFSCSDVDNKTILYYNDNNSHDNNTWQCVETPNNKWLFSTSYWTAVAHKGGQNIIYILAINGTTIYKDDLGTSDDMYGVRPVIEISRSDFNRMRKA